MKRKLELRVGLSAKGLANIPRNIDENDFTFTIGEDRFLSPRIGHLQVSDSTLREFIITTKDRNIASTISCVSVKAGE
jgi:hypothetical protein